MKDAGSELFGVVTMSSAADATFGEVTIQTSDTSYEPLSTFACRSRYVLTDSFGSETILIDEWDLNVRLNCRSNQLTLSGTPVQDTEVLILDSLNTVSVSVTSSASATIPDCPLTETFEIYDSGSSTWL